jgi:hypothetical protein
MFVQIQHLNGRWRAALVKDYKLVNQLRKEAGLSLTTWPDPPDAYDRLLEAAGDRDMGLETFDPPHFSGDPDPAPGDLVSAADIRSAYLIEKERQRVRETIEWNVEQARDLGIDVSDLFQTGTKEEN